MGEPAQTSITSTKHQFCWVSTPAWPSLAQSGPDCTCLHVHLSPRQPGPASTCLPAIHLPACSLSAAARFCQAHRLILSVRPSVLLSFFPSAPSPLPVCLTGAVQTGLALPLTLSVPPPQRLTHTTGWALMPPPAGETPLWGVDSEAPPSPPPSLSSRIKT